MLKNKKVSSVEANIDDVNGAIYHFFFLSLSKIFTSNNCATKKAVPEPIAILIEIKSAKFVENKSVRLTVSNAGVRSVDKKGSFDQFIKSAKTKYLSLRLKKLKRSLLNKSA